MTGIGQQSISEKENSFIGGNVQYYYANNSKIYCPTKKTVCVPTPSVLKNK